MQSAPSDGTAVDNTQCPMGGLIRIKAVFVMILLFRIRHNYKIINKCGYPIYQEPCSECADQKGRRSMQTYVVYVCRFK